MNILLTSAGRRTSLLRAFQEAAHPWGGRVYAGDMDSLAPTIYLADEAVPLPPINSDEYLQALCALVRERDIRLIVPTIDTELPVLANHAELLRQAGCHTMISSPELIRIAGDKWLTVTAYADRNIRTPRSWLAEDLPLDELPEQLFVKPRNGSASQHCYAVTRDALAGVLPQVPHPIIQEVVSGQEITVDALLDCTGRPVHYVPRRRIRTVGGESIQGVTIDDAEIRPWLLSALEVTGQFGGRGPVTLQVFLTERGPVLSEINPRFGGGFPLAYAAGGRYPQWIIAMLYGQHLDAMIGDYRSGLYMTRYYHEHFAEQPLWNMQ